MNTEENSASIPHSAQDEMEAFETWFYGSKYAQVVIPSPGIGQAALDGWNASRAAITTPSIEVMIEKSRPEFERQFLQNDDLPNEAISRKGNGYAWIETDSDWAIWRAAITSIGNEIK